jgi:SAM-dependent methyltransferase
MPSNTSGYVTDIPYLRDFKPMLAPAWLDHVALVAGVEPPARLDNFAWCDLGCGQGVTAAILAATHPTGKFHGIDAMAVHIDHARRLAREAAIHNVYFHTTEFAEALGLRLPQFDYIVAHGVYTWIDGKGQDALRRFIDQRLKPGGLVYLGYNAMPGWARDLPFQRLLRELALGFPGDNAARVAAAGGIIGLLAKAGVPALAGSFIQRELEQRPEDYSPAYLVHEFMPAAWQPLYVTEVRASMARIGLTPVGSATLSENSDCMVLSPEARSALAAIKEPDTRELIRDFFLDQRFRCDVFARSNRLLDANERVDRLLSTTFGLARPIQVINYTTKTPAGTVSYDYPATRAIVGALASGTRSLCGDPPIDWTPAEAVNAVLTLCAAGDVIPIEPRYAKVDKLNRVLCSRVDGPEEIRWLALPSGTAVEVDRALMRLLRDTRDVDETHFPGWRRLLASHGLEICVTPTCGDRARPAIRPQ